MNKSLGLIGLGKMGGGVALQLNQKGWEVYGYNRTSTTTKEYEVQGINGVYDYKEFILKLEAPRTIWVMLTAGEPTEEAILGKNGLINLLEKGDIVIDAANSFFKDSQRRSIALAEKGIKFVDAGVSGGPGGARNGACVMIGGNIDTVTYLDDLFKEVSLKDGYKYFGSAGAGHFVKMVHNGIEYGMMQAIGEGFEVMKQSSYDLNLEDVAHLYNKGSVIESRLVGWLEEGYMKYGQELTDISGSIKHSGEGLWTVQTAEEMQISVPIIKGSLDFRLKSQAKPSYTGRVVSVLRNMFGKHDVSNK